MSIDIKVPSVGESVTEGTIGRWLKKDGEIVRANEPVCELETDKATMEVMAPASGRLTIAAAEGQHVEIGAVIGHIEEGAPARSVSEGTPSAGTASPAPAAAERLLSPAARQLAATEGIEPAQLSGSGRGGRILKEDVLAHLQQQGER